MATLTPERAAPAGARALVAALPVAPVQVETRARRAVGRVRPARVGARVRADARAPRRVARAWADARAPRRVAWAWADTRAPRAARRVARARAPRRVARAARLVGEAAQAQVVAAETHRPRVQARCSQPQTQMAGGATEATTSTTMSGTRAKPDQKRCM